MKRRRQGAGRGEERRAIKRRREAAGRGEFPAINLR